MLAIKQSSLMFSSKPFQSTDHTLPLRPLYPKENLITFCIFLVGHWSFHFLSHSIYTFKHRRRILLGCVHKINNFDINLRPVQESKKHKRPKITVVKNPDQD